MYLCRAWQMAADNMGVDKQVDEAKKRSAGFAKEKLLIEKKIKKLVTDKDKKVCGRLWNRPQVVILMHLFLKYGSDMRFMKQIRSTTSSAATLLGRLPHRPDCFKCLTTV